MSAFISILAAAALAADPSGIAPPPGAVRSMLDAAAGTQDAAQIAAVAAAARKVFPEFVASIDAYEKSLIAGLEPETESAAPVAVAEKSAAEEKPAAHDDFLHLGAWEGKATASAAFASGNSRNAAAGLKLDAKQEAGRLTHNIGIYLDYGESNDVKSQQRWGAAYKLDYRIEDGTYAYGRISYDEDEFSGFDYRLFAGLGLGHTYFDTETFKLKVEGGPGFRYSPIDDSREIEKEFALYSSGELDWVIRPGLTFEQDVNATWTAPTTTLISNTSLTTSLTDTLSTGVSFYYRYETSPPDGKLKSDTTFRLNLTYSY